MKKAYFLLLISMIILLFAIGASAQDIAIVDSEGNEYNHDNYSFYLPSHISPNELTFKISDGVELSYNDSGTFKSIKNGDTVDFSSFYTLFGTSPVYVVSAKINSIDYFLILRFASTLPSVNIQTSIDPEYIIAYSSKDTAVKTTIMANNGEVLYRDNVNAGEFRIRGNATEAYAKKPFQLKLSSGAPLFGMERDKTWLLLANYDDQSLIRNNVMYKIGSELGIDTCEFQNVDLFINGEYYGIYLLCEKVEIDNGRVEISDLEEENDLLNSSYSYFSTSVTSGTLIDSTILTQYSYIPDVTNPTDITGGYLVELDNNYYKNELCYFTTENGNHYVIKSPEYASLKEVEYIAKLFADMEEAIMSSNGYNREGKHYSEYVDIDTLASAYILQELGRNYDAGSSSLYFYKDKDQNGSFTKIVKGPLWDCDNTLGNIHKNDASNPEGYWAKERSIWAGLTSKQEFMTLVREKYAKVYDYIFDMIDYGGYIQKEVEAIGDSIYMEQNRWNSNNYEKWPLYYDGTHYDRWQSAPVFNFCSVYSQGNNEDDTTVIGYLCEHIEARANWLANEWDCDVLIRERITVPPVVQPDDDTIDSDTDIVPPNTDTDKEPEDSNSDVDTNEEPKPSTPTPDMTPDYEEPPAIEEQPKEKGFFEKIWELIVSIFKTILSWFS